MNQSKEDFREGKETSKKKKIKKKKKKQANDKIKMVKS